MREKGKWYQEIDKRLKELMEKSKEIKQVLVADLTGQLIDSKTRDAETGKNEDEIRMLAATFSAMIGAVRSAGEEGKLGHTKAIYVHYKKGTVHISRIGERGALALITSSDANLGAIRLLAKKYSRRLTEAVTTLAESMEQMVLERTAVEEDIPNF